MFLIDHEVHTDPDLLAELGLDNHAIRQILDEPSSFDVRDESEQRKRETGRG